MNDLVCGEGGETINKCRLPPTRFPTCKIKFVEVKMSFFLPTYKQTLFKVRTRVNPEVQCYANL